MKFDIKTLLNFKIKDKKKVIIFMCVFFSLSYFSFFFVDRFQHLIYPLTSYTKVLFYISSFLFFLILNSLLSYFLFTKIYYLKSKILNSIIIFFGFFFLLLWTITDFYLFSIFLFLALILLLYLFLKTKNKIFIFIVLVFDIFLISNSIIFILNIDRAYFKPILNYEYCGDYISENIEEINNFCINDINGDFGLVKLLFKTTSHYYCRNKEGEKIIFYENNSKKNCFRKSS